MKTKEELTNEIWSQVSNRVRFYESNRQMHSMGIDRYVVVGPDVKETTRKTIMKNVPGSQVLVVKNPESLDRAVETLTQSSPVSMQ